MPPIGKDINARERAHATNLLFMVLTRYHILPPLLEHDRILNTKTKYAALHSENIEAVEARTILRGAAMDALVTVTGGDESILASTGAYKLLLSTFHFFNVNPHGRPERLAKSILDGSDESIPNFIQLLTAHFSANKVIQRSLIEHAEIIRQRVFGRYSHVTNISKPKRPRQARASIIKEIQACEPTSISHLIPPGLSLLPIALILREACNRSRGLPYADQALYTILCGKSLTGGRQYPPEQTDPIRGNNAYTQLLLEHLPPASLTSQEGISALLAYMGTGQCSETKGFLSSNRRIFWDHQRCITAFNDAKSANDLILNGNPAIQQTSSKGKKARMFVIGMTRFEFSQVWGQPCCHLSVKDGIVERFGPIFDPKIQERWKSWLGPLVDQDPTKLPAAEKRQWRDALDFVVDLGIKGFSRGLTSLQFANNLWVAGIVTEPSITDIVSWLYINKDLGASKGLQYLGFAVETFKDFRAAFLIVYSHLDEHLSAEDKEILHFGVIFVEHLLCKVSRWKTRLPSYDYFNTKVGGGEWSRSANQGNHLAFPVPETVKTSCLKKAIAEANVSLL